MFKKFIIITTINKKTEAIKKFVNKIGINAELPHVNKSKREKNYREYYNEYTKNLIAKRFKEDIETFNYKF